MFVRRTPPKLKVIAIADALAEFLKTYQEHKRSLDESAASRRACAHRIRVRDHGQACPARNAAESTAPPVPTDARHRDGREELAVFARRCPGLRYPPLLNLFTLSSNGGTWPKSARIVQRYAGFRSRSFDPEHWCPARLTI